MDKLEPINFPFQGVQVIEASAGTGKTWTIEALYLRLLLGDGCPALKPDQILVVTFTNAATDELRSRIRTRIAKGIACFRGEAVDDEFLNTLRNKWNKADHEECAARLDLAMQWMDEAAIHTIHGWCSQVLRRFPLAGKALGAMEVVDSDELLIEVIRDYWRTHCLDLPTDLRDTLSKHNQPDKLVFGVKKRLRTTSPTLVPLSKFLEDARKPMKAAFAAIQQQLRSTRADIDALLDQGVASGQMKIQARYRASWLDAVDQWCALDGVTDIALLDKPIKNLTGKGWSGRWTDGAAPHDHPFVQALVAAVATAQRYKDADLGHVFDHAAGWCEPRLETLKAQRGIAGSDDLVRRVARALGATQGPALASRLRERYPVAMVDEFQDTDRVQWSIFRHIYHGVKGVSLTLIGDPKQSIYGFRGADVDTYLAARNSADRVFRLDRNFRSSAALVTAVNRVFEHADRHALGAFLKGDDIGFAPILDAGKEADVFPALTFWHTSTPMNGDDFRGVLARACAQGVVEQLRTGTRPQDIAVLVRSWREAASVRWALDHRGVRSVYLSENDSVYASAEARDVLTLLDACAHPRDDRRVRAAVAIPLLRRPLTELARLTEDEMDLERLLERFYGYHELWQTRGVLSLLYRIAHDYALLHEDTGARTLTNYLHLADLLQNEAETMEGEHALLRRLRECIDTAGAASGSEDHVVRLESDDDVVRVVTIHKSKGLEYPYVFLPYGTAPQREYGDDDDAAAETQRLLYVALTRARRAVWVGTGPTTHGGAHSHATHRSLLGHVLSGGEFIPPDALPELLQELKGPVTTIAIAPPPEDDGDAWIAPAPKGDFKPARVYRGAPRTSWWIGSYSALKLGPQRYAPLESARAQVLQDADEPETFSQASTDDSIHRLPRGADTGNFLHGLLEWAAEVGFATAAKEDEARHAEVARRCRYRFEPSAVPVLDRWLQALLVTPLPVAGGQLPLTSLSDYRSELEFFIAAQQVDVQRIDDLVTQHILPGQGRPGVETGVLNGMLKGFIDLVFGHDGRWFVADFKSNALGDDDSSYTQAAMEAQILKKRYDLQFTLYTLALHRLLKVRLGTTYDYDQHVGEAVYLFLRGIHEPTQHGVFALKPPRALIEALDALFDGQEVSDAA